MTKYQKDPTCCIFLKRGLFKDIKNDISMNQTCKYKNTNTQIQHMIKYQKDPTCCIFLKRGLFKDIKNDIPMSQIGEYKNTNLRLTNAKKTQHVVYFWREDCSWIFSESRMVVQGLVSAQPLLTRNGEPSSYPHHAALLKALYHLLIIAFYPSGFGPFGELS